MRREKQELSERRRRRLRTVSILPTLFTLGNLVCGFFAIVVAARVAKPFAATIDPADAANCMISGWLIFLAMIFDALDGHLARLAKTNSDFGAQLDSLCDLVTFGVAPGFLLVKMCPAFILWHDEAVWVIAAGFAVCAALRLARFNCETTKVDDHMHFSGLPSPAAAASIASFAIAFYALSREDNPLRYANEISSALQFILPIFGLLVAVLMVSRVPYPHVVNQLLRGKRSFNHLVGLVLALVAVMLIRGYSVPIICCVFVLWSPLRYLWRVFVQQRLSPQAALNRLAE